MLVLISEILEVEKYKYIHIYIPLDLCRSERMSQMQDIFITFRDHLRPSLGGNIIFLFNYNLECSPLFEKRMKKKQMGTKLVLSNKLSKNQLIFIFDLTF